MDQADLLKLSSLLNKFQKECVAERKEIIPGLFGEVYNAENVQRDKDINNIIMTRYLVSEKINEGIAPLLEGGYVEQ